LDYSPDVNMSVEELLSMPAGNRAQVAKQRGNEFVPQLNEIAFSKEEDYRVRWKALILSVQIQGVRAEKTLDKALASSEWYMRNAAILAYQEVLPAKAKYHAQDLLADKALVVRSAAVEVLSKSLSDDGVRETLWDQMGQRRNFRKNQSLFIRGQILKALSEDPLQKELPLFVKHLRENDIRMHVPAIQALERITARKFGKNSDTLGKRRDLWMKWAKNSVDQKSD
jgi:hypothetical protein